MESDVRLKHLSAFLKFVGVQDRYAAPHSRVTLGENRSMCCKTAGEKSSGNWIVFVSRESEIDWWSCQGEKYNTVAFTCNHRKERFAFLRTTPLLLQTDTQPGRL